MNNKAASGVWTKIWTGICLIAVLFLSYVFIVANAFEKFEEQIDGYNDLILQCRNRNQWKKKINEVEWNNGTKTYETRYYVETYCSDFPRYSETWANEDEREKVERELYANRLHAETMRNRAWIAFLVTIIVGFIVWRTPFIIVKYINRSDELSSRRRFRIMTVIWSVVCLLPTLLFSGVAISNLRWCIESERDNKGLLDCLQRGEYHQKTYDGSLRYYVEYGGESEWWDAKDENGKEKTKEKRKA